MCEGSSVGCWSEPSALPFDEVWCGARREFVALSKGSPFAGVATVGPPTDMIGCKTTRILAGELADVWQQQRDFGLMHRRVSRAHPVRLEELGALLA